MGTDDGTVNDQVLHIWIINEAGMHLLPDAVVAPASKPLVHAVPFAILFRQQTPLGTAPRNPEDAFDEATTTCLASNVYIGRRPQEAQDLGPLFIGQFDCHGANYALKCQQCLVLSRPVKCNV